MTAVTLALALPTELIAAILIELDIQDLVRCREVCTEFKTLIDDDVRAQYKLQLAVSGMQDNPSSPFTLVERFSMLRTHQKAWNEFAWTAQENILRRQGHGWELSGNVLAQLEGRRTLHFKRVPSAVRGIEGTEWAIPDVDCDITGFSMDPSQDLLFVIEHLRNGNSELTCRIHLLALSTGTPHPAGPPEGMLTHKLKPGPSSCFTEASENHLGMLVACGERKELLVWDWKLGTLRLHLTGRELCSWTFLTSHLVVVATTRYRHNEETRSMVHVPLLAVFELDPGSLAPSEPLFPVPLSDANPVCTFEFPPLADDIVVLDMLIQSDPKPTNNASPAPLVPGSGKLPSFSLSSDPGHRLLLVSLWAMSSYTQEIVMRALIPASTVLRALSKSQSNPPVVSGQGSPEAWTGRNVAWAEWGQHGARLFATSGRGTVTPEEACFVYGTVFVTTQVDLGANSDANSEADSDEDVDMDSDADADAPHANRRRMTVIVRDFNQLALRRHAHAADPGSESEGIPSSSACEGPNVHIVTDATVFEPARLFKEPVTTTLPYTERMMVLSQSGEGQEDTNWDEVIPTEDALVLAVTGWDSDFRCRIMSI